MHTFQTLVDHITTQNNNNKLCTGSLTSDGLLGYLADVHRDGCGDASEAGAGNQTRHV